MYISKEWTANERMLLIGRLEAELNSGNLTGGKVFDLQERIRFLRVMPAEFLEANRDAILNGNVVPEHGYFRSWYDKGD